MIKIKILIYNYKSIKKEIIFVILLSIYIIIINGTQ